MKTIGLIGGTTWHSTIDYYRVINETINNRLGGDASAKILLYSVNYSEIIPLTKRQDWDSIAQIICAAAKTLEAAGAHCILLCANTMHLIAERVMAVINIPLIHIVDGVIKAIKEKNLTRVLLLGTKYTMSARFYSDPLELLGIQTFTPDENGIEIINASIYNEMGKGVFLPETKRLYLDIINGFGQKGAQGVILGCTEIPMLIKQADSTLPLFNTTVLHAVAAVDFALT